MQLIWNIRKSFNGKWGEGVDLEGVRITSVEITYAENRE